MKKHLFRIVLCMVPLLAILAGCAATPVKTFDNDRFEEKTERFDQPSDLNPDLYTGRNGPGSGHARFAQVRNTFQPFRGVGDGTVDPGIA